MLGSEVVELYATVGGRATHGADETKLTTNGRHPRTGYCVSWARAAGGRLGPTRTLLIQRGRHNPATCWTLPKPVAATAILAEIAEDLVRAVLRSHREERVISLLAISVSHIEEQPVVQLDLPLDLADEVWRPGARRGMTRLLSDRAIDAIRDRFGWESVGYASVALGARRSVPDAFRELAERQL